MKKDTQPAKMSYFFGPSWRELGDFIKNSGHLIKKI